MKKIKTFYLEFIGILSVSTLAIVSLFFDLPQWMNFAMSFLAVSFLGYSFFKLLKYHSKIEATISDFERMKNNISGTSDQIQGSCLQLDNTVDEQLSAIEMTSSAGDEIFAMVNRNNENVRNVDDSISTINEIVEKSSVSIAELEGVLRDGEGTSNDIIEMIENFTNLLNELTVSFKGVVDKTAIINDIVFQTKLLSFNASVEAARAGEHGKGFAVVAEEIGNLATMSGKSSIEIQETLEVTDKQVKKIIQDITKGSESLTSQLRIQSDSTARVLSGFKLNFDDTRDGTFKIKNQVNEVLTATEEQSKGIDEINRGMHQISNSVQQNTLVISQTNDLSNILSEAMVGFDKTISSVKSYFHLDSKLELEELLWEEKFCVGIAKVDGEHQELLGKINKLIQSMNTNDQRQMKKRMQDLAQYTVFHFSEEEEYMRSINYPALESHQKVHENLLGAVSRFQDALNQGNLDRPKLASFLRNWLFTHIVGVDSKYADHARDRNELKLVV